MQQNQIDFKGKFIKPCPGTPHYICCDYYVVNLGNQCSLDCTYCILQAYFDEDAEPVLHSNTDQLVAELEQLLTENPDKKYRIGTGEFGDSMELEGKLHLADKLIPLTEKYNNLAWEFKTKTVAIQPFLQQKNKERVILSWSLNSDYISGLYERKTPSPDQRLAAAETVVKAGYKVGFHFDPIIRYDNWQSGYQAAIEKIAQKIPPEQISWISLGCLRFMPRLKDTIRKRHENVALLHDEFIPGVDGKSRYFKPIRIKLYQFILAEIERNLPGVFVYFCMESAVVWQQVFGFVPGEDDSPTLGSLLDDCCWQT